MIWQQLYVGLWNINFLSKQDKQLLIKWLCNNSWVIITTANLHFLIREKPWASLTPHSGCFPNVRTSWLDQGRNGHFDNKIGFYRVFAKNPSPLCTIFRICLTEYFWLKVKFSLGQEWSGRSVLTNGKHPWWSPRLVHRQSVKPSLSNEVEKLFVINYSYIPNQL